MTLPMTIAMEALNPLCKLSAYFTTKATPYKKKTTERFLGNENKTETIAMMTCGTYQTS